MVNLDRGHCLDREGALKKCFVISPFGRPGSDTRRMADRVLKDIIRPALGHAFRIDDASDEFDKAIIQAGEFSELGIGTHVERADEQAQQYGDLLRDVATSIVSHDLVVAVLFDKNPNAYYELAIAHAAARPVIILRHHDEVIPADLRWCKTIDFDLNHLDLDSSNSLEELKGMLARAAEKACSDFEENRKKSAMFAFNNPELDALGQSFNKYRVFGRFSEFRYDDWSAAIISAGQFVSFAGVSLFDLTRIDNNDLPPFFGPPVI